MKNFMQLPGEVKSLEMSSGTGYFSGYASMFDYVDNQMDVVLHGAFERTLADNSHGRDIKLLWQHNPSEPIGYFTNVVEDNHGLYVEGYILQDVARGREAYSLLKSGAVKGLSIGYNVKNYNVDNKSGIRIINDLDLFEISLVTFPANDMAKVIEVKSAPVLELEEVDEISLIGLIDDAYADTVVEADDDIRFKKLDMLHDMTLWNVNSMEVLDGLKRYNPNQPRVPAGNSDGGQWSGFGGGGSGFGRNRSASGTDKVRRKEPKLVSFVDDERGEEVDLFDAVRVGNDEGSYEEARNQFGSKLPPNSQNSGGLKVPKSWGDKNVENFRDHYKRHANDFNVKSAQEYARKAQIFYHKAQRNRMSALSYPKGGKVAVYDAKTNTFAVYNKNGTTATFFKPKNGESFFKEKIRTQLNRGGSIFNLEPELDNSTRTNMNVMHGGGGGGGGGGSGSGRTGSKPFGSNMNVY